MSNGAKRGWGFRHPTPHGSTAQRKDRAGDWFHGGNWIRDRAIVGSGRCASDCERSEGGPCGGRTGEAEFVGAGIRWRLGERGWNRGGDRAISRGRYSGEQPRYLRAEAVRIDSG